MMVIFKLADWVLRQLLANSCYKAATKLKTSCSFFLKNPSLKSPPSSSKLGTFPSFARFSLENNNKKFDNILISDFHNVLLRNNTFFPYFMLVAFEGGGILRSILLLTSSSFLWVLSYQLQLKVMIFITFCGLKVNDMSSVSRAVLPKFYLENLNLQAYELMSLATSRVVLTKAPKVMIEGFLREYLSVDKVIGTELQTLGNFFTGFVCGSVKHKAVKEHFGDQNPDIGLGSSSLNDHQLLSLCKEAYVMNKEERKRSSIIPRQKYPKPLVFHDGRLAFLPTPLATLSMFIWLPIGILLAIFRLFVGIFLPYKLAIILGSLSGVRITINDYNNTSTKIPSCQKGVLYVCTHRTLLDPVFLSTVLKKPLTAVTYSLSKMSEVMAPIKTVRLTRDRKQDGEKMEKLLSEGDLVVCPEGTTCREPYLLRFSSLFAELADEIVPVAMNTEVNMFYGTTASGLKCLDPIFFLMNPRPCYKVEILCKIPKELTCAGGRSSYEVANYIQRKLADTLGFECTNLTRKDKYLMLAGNEGFVS